MQKRVADILEKFGIGSLLVGLYQGHTFAVLTGLASIAGCLCLTGRLK